jgi:hypothetical protein
VDKTEFKIDGFIESKAPALEFVLTPQHDYKFDIDGKPVEVKNGTSIKLGASPSRIHFVGTSHMHTRKCEALPDEIYCLNNSMPNPEVLSDAAYYRVEFEVPDGFSALAADGDVLQRNGLEFQIAKLAAPMRRQAGKKTIEFVFPEGFEARKVYLDYITQQLRDDVQRFGDLPYSTLKVGAIRRDAGATINGNPSGNLILFSRNAFGDSFNSPVPEKLGIKEDISDGLRKVVIAHELSHLWFGTGKFLGQDGWMVEGIPQYIGLVAATTGKKKTAKPVIAFFEKMAEHVPKGPIVSRQLGNGGPGDERAYWVASMGLYHLGEKLGHRKLISFLLSVYSVQPNPKFDDFDRAFQKKYPKHLNSWREIWQLGQS